MTETDALAAKQWIDDFARASESREALDRLVNATNDRIVEALPEFGDPTLRTELYASTRAHWKGFLSVVNCDTIDVQLGPPVYDLARTLARRGYELPLLLSVYRIGQRAVWQHITQRIQTEVPDPGVRSAVLLQLWSHVSLWLDTAVESLIVVFSAEREQWQRGTIARNTALVHAILAGKLIDVDDASAALGYPLRQHHTAFTVRVDHNVWETEVRPLLEASARRFSADVNGCRPLIVSSGARSAWCWTATPTAVESIGVDAGRDIPRHVHISAGNCHPGVDGFRLSHNEAVAALAMAGLRGTQLVRFNDVEIACLTAGVLDDESRSAFVRRELRSLADSDETAERLRETLQVYLTNGGDATVKGQSLRLHPNTVRYRIRQAEKKLGHPIGHRRVYVELALEIVNVLGMGRVTVTR